MPTETRKIVRDGVLILPEDMAKGSSLTVTCFVERVPGNRYLNVKSQKAKSFYGIWQAMAGEVVLATGPLEYEQQRIWEEDRGFIQLAITNACKFYQTQKLIYDSSLLLWTLGSAAPFLVPEPVKPSFTIPLLDVERFVFRLFNNTTLYVVATTGEFDNTCDATIVYVPSTTQLHSDLEVPDIPENSAIPGEDIPDEPYDPDTEDNGETYVPQLLPSPPLQLGVWQYQLVVYSSINGYATTYNQSITGDNYPLPEMKVEEGSLYLVYYQNGTRTRQGFGGSDVNSVQSFTLGAFTPQ